MNYIIRLDDFPYGDIESSKMKYKKLIVELMDIIRPYNIPTILGVSPYLMKIDDFTFLNDILTEEINICMHGFTHAVYDKPDWSKGGEFSEMSKTLMEVMFIEGRQQLNFVKYFNQEHFIPPFNCFNQTIIDVLFQYGVTDLYTCDKEYKEFNQDKFDYYNINLHVSEYLNNYGYIDVINNNLKNNLIKSLPITLHWLYDIKKFYDWKDRYKEMCERIKSMDMWGIVT